MEDYWFDEEEYWAQQRDAVAPHWTTFPSLYPSAFEARSVWHPGVRGEREPLEANEFEGELEAVWREWFNEALPNEVASRWFAYSIGKLYPNGVIEEIEDHNPLSTFYVPMEPGFVLQAVTLDGFYWKTVQLPKHPCVFDWYEDALSVARAHNHKTTPLEYLFVTPVPVAKLRESHYVQDDRKRDPGPEHPGFTRYCPRCHHPVKILADGTMDVHGPGGTDPEAGECKE